MNGSRRPLFAVAVAGLAVLVCTTSAHAGSVAEQFHSGAFGLSWSANKSAIQAKYPGGHWDKDDTGIDRYCAPSQQTLLGLPAPHQTRELCFLLGADGTMASATARLAPTLPSLLAIVNRSRTRFGDFDAIKRDGAAVQSRYTYMMWTRDAPIVVMVGSSNDESGRPNMVAFTVSEEASLFVAGAEKVSNRPAGGGR